MALFKVEARQTMEWGGYYEADNIDEAKEKAWLDVHFDTVLDRDMIATVVEDES